MQDNDLKAKAILTEGDKLNAFGMEISIADIIGEKVVDKWFAQLSEDDMNLIFKAVEDEIFGHDYLDHKFFKTTRKYTSTYGSTREEETPIWQTTKQKFAEKYNEVILSKVDEIIASEEYQKRAQEIAGEIVNFATEGYKKALEQRVYERMVGNVVESEPHYNSIPLRDIIKSVVQEYVPTINY